MHNTETLILEVLKQESRLSMSVFAQAEQASTIRHYSQCQISPKEIAQLCQEIISVLNKSDRKGDLEPEALLNFKKTGQLLWDNLLSRPVKEKLKNTSIKNLLLSLDEELISIPWELFYDGNEFLCLKFSLGRLVRTQGQLEPVRYRSVSSVPKMLILANPTNDLKSAYLEGKFIRDEFDRRRNQIKIDFKSTDIDTFYLKKNLRDYDLVHFAGHCEYDADEGKNSGWVLSDGMFGAQDIISLSESRTLPSLIFSNACYSAQEPGNFPDSNCQEKAYSVAAAFLFSGVRHYLGTILKIEDTVSLEFAREFYLQLISGESVGESMRLARIKLIKKYGENKIFWASYLLYGDPNFVLLRSKVKTPAVKLRKRAWAGIQRFLRPAIVAVALFLLISSLILIPTKSPQAYFLFLRSQQMFLQGRNQEVIALSRKIIQHEPLFLASYPILADTYRRLGDKENAIKYYFEYAFSAEKKNDAASLAKAYTGIGWTYQLSGDYPEALEFYQKAINLSREKGDKLNEAAAMEKLAVWYIDKENFDQALELLTKSSEINRERQHLYEHRYNLACDYFDLGIVFASKNDFSTARDFYRKSQSLFEKLKLENELSDCHFNLGEIYLYEKQYQKALTYYLRGLEIDKKQGNLPYVAGGYNMIGELYLAMGNSEKAEEEFRQALFIAEQLKAKPELASVYYNLGTLYREKRQFSKARDYLRLAQELYRQMELPAYQKIRQELSNQS
ncbi:MAG: tetratricopeptide repeat protein [Candidatus Omnitrophica bacterium]|nr:tetratricopeptide repeat protein [Candidatus Omnitrophota bacterium]